MRTALSLVLCSLLLAGCDFFQDMKGMFEKSQLVAKAIKDKHGWETQVGFNMTDARLVDVTVSFHAREVREQKVATLESAALEAIAKVFASKPETVYVQIVSQPGT